MICILITCLYLFFKDRRFRIWSEESSESVESEHLITRFTKFVISCSIGSNIPAAYQSGYSARQRNQNPRNHGQYQSNHVIKVIKIMQDLNNLLK